MASQDLSTQDTDITTEDVPRDPPSAPPALPTISSPSTTTEEPKYAGFTRFEIELEFVQSLASPLYLQHLAASHYLSQPAFVAYLSYLQYWSHPPYTKYLTYPGPTLRNLELLQQERFRSEVLNPGVVQVLMEDGIRRGLEGPGGGVKTPTTPTVAAGTGTPNVVTGTSS